MQIKTYVHKPRTCGRCHGEKTVAHPMTKQRIVCRWCNGVGERFSIPPPGPLQLGFDIVENACVSRP